MSIAETEFEEYRKQNSREMDKRIERANEYLRTSYPMTADNMCRSMNEQEFGAHIRRKRAEFEARRA